MSEVIPAGTSHEWRNEIEHTPKDKFRYMVGGIEEREEIDRKYYAMFLARNNGEVA